MKHTEEDRSKTVSSRTSSSPHLQSSYRQTTLHEATLRLLELGHRPLGRRRRAAAGGLGIRRHRAADPPLGLLEDPVILGHCGELLDYPRLAELREHLEELAL